MLVKLDVEKAYDKLSWTFIEDTLTKLGLPDNLIKTIMLCFTIVFFRLLLE